MNNEHFRDKSPEKNCRPAPSRFSCVRSRSDRGTVKLSDGSLSISNLKIRNAKPVQILIENSMCSF